MLKYFYLVLGCGFLLFGACWAQALQADITEISPHKVNDEEEWFEFRVWGAMVDLGSWIIKDQKGKTKKVADVADQLIWGEGVEVIDKATLKFRLLDGKGYFAWTKSPVSLPNSGGQVSLWSEDQLLAEADYPKLKSGSYQSAKYAEVWTRDPDHGRFYPRLHRTFPGSPDRHSKTKSNAPAPPFGDQAKILISEIGMNQEEDFIELRVQDLKGSSDFEYLKIKHNGSTIHEGRLENEVEEGDYIVLKPPKGLSGGSGTIEVVLWSGTSWEVWSDVMCYRHGAMSKTETNRVEKWIKSGIWQGDCGDIASFPKGVTLVRQTPSDTDQSSDFSPLVKPSPGSENVHENQRPQAVITLQNTDKTRRRIPFSVNLTGEGSMDPDGDHDIISYQWTVNDEPFDGSDNPSYYRIEEVGVYHFELTVRDLGGLSDVDQIVIEAVDKAIKTPKSKSPKEVISERGKSSEAAVASAWASLEKDTFFEGFTAYAQDFDQAPKLLNPIETPKLEDHYFTQKTARERLAYWGQTEAVKHNLGCIFLEGH